MKSCEKNAVKQEPKHNEPVMGRISFWLKKKSGNRQEEK